MIIVIDGYNVLKQALHKVEISQTAKDTFIKQLGKYGKKKVMLYSLCLMGVAQSDLIKIVWMAFQWCIQDLENLQMIG